MTLNHDSNFRPDQFPVRGWVLPAVFVLLIIVGLSSRELLFHALHRLDVTRTIRTRVDQENELIESIGSTEWPSTAPSCREQRLEGVSLAGSWKVCGDSMNSFKAIPHTGAGYYLFDLNLFDDQGPCPGTTVALNQRDSVGPVAARDCVVSARISSPLILQANIRASNLQMLKDEIRSAGLIAVTGRASLNRVVLAEQDVLLMAGGNIDIETLESTSLERTRITIISLQGDIIVRRIRGQISALAIGRRNLSVPVSPFVPPFPLPLLRSPSIASIGIPDR